MSDGWWVMIDMRWVEVVAIVGPDPAGTAKSLRCWLKTGQRERRCLTCAREDWGAGGGRPLTTAGLLVSIKRGLSVPSH